jgi:hypothetical protein
VEADRAPGAEARPDRPAAEVYNTRDRQRHSVRHAKWLHVARPASRSAALSRYIPLVTQLAGRRLVEAHTRCPSRARPQKGGQDAQTDGGGPRQPNRQDDRTGRPPRLRWGKKVVGRERHVVVDTLGLVWALVVTPACTQDLDGATLALEAFRESVKSPKVIRATRRISPWPVGPGFAGPGASRSSPAPRDDSRSSRNAGLSNGPLAGSSEHGGPPSHRTDDRARHGPCSRCRDPPDGQMFINLGYWMSTYCRDEARDARVGRHANRLLSTPRRGIRRSHAKARLDRHTSLGIDPNRITPCRCPRKSLKTRGGEDARSQCSPTARLAGIPDPNRVRDPLCYFAPASATPQSPHRLHCGFT